MKLNPHQSKKGSGINFMDPFWGDQQRNTYSLYKLKYAIYDSNKNRFNSPVTVTEALNIKVNEKEIVLTNGKQSEYREGIIPAKTRDVGSKVREGKEQSGIYYSIVTL